MNVEAQKFLKHFFLLFFINKDVCFLHFEADNSQMFRILSISQNCLPLIKKRGFVHLRTQLVGQVKIFIINILINH